MLDPFREFVNSKRTGADSTIAIENCHSPYCGRHESATPYPVSWGARQYPEEEGSEWIVACWSGGNCNRKIEFIGSKRTAVIAFYDRIVPNYSKPTEVFPCSTCSTSPTP